MKFQRIQIISKTCVFLFFLGTTFQSCQLSGGITTEKDIVRKSTRMKIDYTLYTTSKYKSPIYKETQTILKETFANKEPIYRVFEIIPISDNYFKLEDNAFLIIDQEVVPIKFDEKVSDNVTKVMENKKNILTADSIKLSVVTGLSTTQTVVTRLSYQLDLSTVAKIKNAEKLQIRYYSGAEMITFQLAKSNLTSLKKLIDLNPKN